MQLTRKIKMVTQSNGTINYVCFNQTVVFSPVFNRVTAFPMGWNS